MTVLSARDTADCQVDEMSTMKMSFSFFFLCVGVPIMILSIIAAKLNRNYVGHLCCVAKIDGDLPVLCSLTSEAMMQWSLNRNCSRPFRSILHQSKFTFVDFSSVEMHIIRVSPSAAAADASKCNQIVNLWYFFLHFSHRIRSKSRTNWYCQLNNTLPVSQSHPLLRRTSLNRVTLKRKSLREERKKRKSDNDYIERKCFHYSYCQRRAKKDTSQTQSLFKIEVALTE